MCDFSVHWSVSSLLCYYWNPTYVRTNYISGISQKAQIEYYLISEKLFIVRKVRIKCNLIKMSSPLSDIFDYEKYLMQ